MFKSNLSCLFGLVLTTSSLIANAAAQTPTFTNPVLYEDFPDNDVFVGPDDAYYFSASSFHYSPGAPILKSHDLVNWELISHSVPRLDFGSGYDLAPETRTYRGGIWASTMRYRQSNGLWYWLGCTNFWNNWIYSAPNATGPWTRLAYLGGGNCYYDTGMLIDDDDVMYVVYGNPNVRIAQLASDAKSEVKSTSVLNATDVGVDAIEGNRLYKINGTYYILNDHPGDTTYVWKSMSGSIWGPYESKVLVKNVKPPIEGGSSPHQGSLVRTGNGDWYYMSFTWAYPAGRLPVLAPITWGPDGFPTFVNGSNGGWGASYPLPLPAKQTPPWTGTYRFNYSTLPPQFEWNHDPDISKFSVDNGLTLSTASVTSDLYQARNTLTHRTHGEFPTATVQLDISELAEGDRTGLAAFRDRSAYIGIHRSNGTNTIIAAFNATIDEFSGATLDNGTIVASIPVPSDTRILWVRTNLDARPNGSKAAEFFYSMDGRRWEQLGGTYELYTGWAFFLGYRFAVFNYATVALGGQIRIKEWTVA
ncbi:glycoside hydrolase family 43 protein [Trematosphaeria pertusa]|uniref:Glycoside hydrolase family 43 protein n=1 Tax=Trematosphaeria pertusa TaxID=390896 RepID=A0A6A6IPF4_9PLEO|nr:glycoside hydrolase family 43 protein [Trematosphaeria pertusa]KAF2251682.1 glycoside hydrolase family 43 protein [Trematosphaeria pertusa]